MIIIKDSNNVSENKKYLPWIGQIKYLDSFFSAIVDANYIEENTVK
jgi:hypothetical protein